MITLCILLILAIVILVIAMIALGIGGIAFIFTFGDVIVCVLLIWWLIKRILKRKENKRK